MICYAKVVSINKNIEEEIVLSFGGFELTCFSGCCPYEILVNNVYPVELYLFFIDEMMINQSSENILKIERINDTFSYKICGILYNDKIILEGLYFNDAYFMSEFGYLDSKFVDVLASRIDVSFL